MKKTLLVLVGALVLLGLILIKKGKDEKSMRSDAPVLDSTLKADVKSVNTAKRPDSTALLVKDGQWVVTASGFPVDTARINKLLKNIFSLQDKEIVSHNPERYAEYGLDSIEAKHVILKNTSGKVIADVIIGKTSGSDYSSTYWRWANKPDVYRTPGNFSWEIVTKEDDWKERKLAHVKATEVRTIETTWHDSLGFAFHYKLEATSDSTWKMLEPEDSSRVNKAMVSEMTNRFTALSIDEFVSPQDTNLAKVNVDSPSVSVKFTFKDGKSMELKGSKTLGTFSYVKHPSRTELIKLSAYQFEAFKKKPFELLDAPPAPAPDTSKVEANPPK
jgi:Domain of unknown function (DUF4340)